MKKISTTSKLLTRFFLFLVIALLLVTPGMSLAQSGEEPESILTPQGFNVITSSGGFPINIAPENTQVHSFDLLPAAIYPDEVSSGTTTRVSVSSTGKESTWESFGGSLNDNGRFVTFVSRSPTLVPGVINDKQDVFIHDNLTGWTGIVSVSSDWYLGNSHSSGGSISADGRYIVFDSSATTFVKGDTNNSRDVFVRDLLKNKTIRVSISSDGDQGNHNSSSGRINADGRYVAFKSKATDLVIGDIYPGYDILIHDILTGETSFVSISSEGEQANDSSDSPSISDDGRFVAFSSEATNLVENDTNGVNDIFVHDNITGETNRVSVSSEGAQGNSYSLYPSISGNGRYVVFSSVASNLVNGDTNEVSDVFVHDRDTGETTSITVPFDPLFKLFEYSNAGAISADGRYVTFTSNLYSLHCNQSSSSLSVFLHDRETNETKCVSVSSEGIIPNSQSGGGSISADGTKIGFTSWADNLIPNDTNKVADVFLHDWGGTYSISGRILPEDLPDISDTTLYLADEYGWLIGEVNINSDGSYSLSNMRSGTYLLLPWKNGYLFNPEYLYVTVPEDAVDKNFTASIITHSPDTDEKLTASKATFSWDAIPHVASYKLQVSKLRDFSIVDLSVKTTDPSYFFDSFLKNSTIYYWRVRPIYADGKDPWLPTWRFTSMDPLGQPTLVSPAYKEILNTPDVMLEWTSVENAAQYKVLIAKDAAFTQKVAKLMTPELSALFEDLPDGKYYWRVKAFDAYGAKGPWTNYRIFKIISDGSTSQDDW